MKLTHIIISALVVFETSIPKALKDGKIDERKEFDMLSALYMNHLIICPMLIARWKQKVNTDSKKSTGTDQRPKEGIKEKRCPVMCTLFPVYYLVCYQNV